MTTTGKPNLLIAHSEVVDQW